MLLFSFLQSLYQHKWLGVLIQCTARELHREKWKEGGEAKESFSVRSEKRQRNHLLSDQILHPIHCFDTWTNFGHSWALRAGSMQVRSEKDFSGGSYDLKLLKWLLRNAHVRSGRIRLWHKLTVLVQIFSKMPGWDFISSIYLLEDYIGKYIRQICSKDQNE